jgi:RNA polymerase sigma factor (sigma-70 family)
MTGGISQGNDPTLQLACRHAVRALIESHDWVLPREDDLVQWVLDSIGTGAPPNNPERVVYSVALYEACRQTADAGRRERAFLELHRFLFRTAYRRWPELAEDATQRALVLIFEQMNRCQRPVTFLSFTFFKLLQAFKTEWRIINRDAPLPLIAAVVLFQPDLDQQEAARMLIEAIRRLPDRREQQVILLKFLGGLSDEAIAARLQLTVGHVRTLRHRGMARLRSDKRLADYFGRMKHL